ncbi:uncharacterized protein [Onthophagus taurus]|uniref:uncharacterized protein n=1 Tax=Onthophagus taurus TaxID=166361 RepID=UPI0039BE4A61
MYLLCITQFVINFCLIICVHSFPKISFNTAGNDTNEEYPEDVYGSVLNDTVYGPIFTDNTTDEEDLIKGPYRHEYQIGKVLGITLPTTICFLLLIIFVCLICRPKTHFVSHFTRPRYELCRHQKKTHEAYRLKHAPTPQEREQKRLEELRKEEERIEKIKEKRRLKREKKFAKQQRKCDKRHEARVQAHEKAKTKHIARLQKLKLQREKDIQKKIKKKAFLEERRDELLEREGREPRIDRSRRSKSLIYGSGKMLDDDDRFIREDVRLRRSTDELSQRSSEKISFVDLRDKRNDDRSTRIRGPPRERHYD